MAFLETGTLGDPDIPAERLEGLLMCTRDTRIDSIHDIPVDAVCSSLGKTERTEGERLTWGGELEELQRRASVTVFVLFVVCAKFEHCT